jgi:hypothetical protein
MLGQTDQTRHDLAAAERYAFHPIEKHIIPYFYGQVAETARRPAEAIRHYDAVIADRIPSWYRQLALEAIARLQPPA